MISLITALIGVGLSTLGIFLFFSNRFSGRIKRPSFGSEALSISLITGGGVLLISAMTLAPSKLHTTQQFDPNQLLDENPTSSGISQSNREIAAQRYPALPQFILPYKNILVLTWGTPNDNDTADSLQITDYSLKLRKTTIDLLDDYTTNANFITPDFTRVDYETLLVSPSMLQKWCNNNKTDLVIAIGVGPTKINDEYALWREPIYEALDCKTQQASRQTGQRINERSGDRYPYQLSVLSNISNLLNDFIEHR